MNLTFHYCIQPVDLKDAKAPSSTWSMHIALSRAPLHSQATQSKHPTGVCPWGAFLLLAAILFSTSSPSSRSGAAGKPDLISHDLPAPLSVGTQSSFGPFSHLF